MRDTRLTYRANLRRGEHAAQLAVRVVGIARRALLDEVQDHPPMLLQMVQGAAIVTALELLVGLIVNRWLGWDVWDYSDMPGNLWGQVCPQFAAAWLLLSWAAGKLENLMHKWAGDAQ